MRILIADDEVDFTSLVAERLKGKGHDVDVVYDGKEALKIIKSKKYDLIFLDHNMPELTGLELARYLKDNKFNVRTVMVTGYEEMSGPFAKAVGVSEYLTKPVKMEDIDKMVEKYNRRG